MLETRYAAGALRAFASILLEKSCLSTEKAVTVATVLLEADLLGHTTHGLALLPDYLDEIAHGRITIDGEPDVISKSPASAVWDGRRLPGPWLVMRATEEAVERAREIGTVTLAIRRSHHTTLLALPPI